MNLPNPVLRSHYGNGFIKQYVRDHLILRTEPASNNVDDYGITNARCILTHGVQLNGDRPITEEPRHFADHRGAL